MVAWHELPARLRDVDVNLAPLVPGSIFNEAKSAIKWLEAALVETPTVATPTAPFVEAIDAGRTGMLATSVEEWEQALSVLLDDDIERRRIGSQARRDALLTLSPHRQARVYEEILRDAARHVRDGGRDRVAGGGQRPIEERGRAARIAGVERELGEREEGGRVVRPLGEDAFVVGACGGDVAAGAGDVGGERGDADEVGIGADEGGADLGGDRGAPNFQMQPRQRDLRRGAREPGGARFEVAQRRVGLAGGEGEPRPFVEQPCGFAAARLDLGEQRLGVLEVALGSIIGDDRPLQLGREARYVARRQMQCAVG
jgi:hypothetical protein